MPKPIVLCFSGADPCGGAGIQADIEAISSMGCHAATVTTALTVQNSHGVTSYQAIDADYLRAQSQALIADMPVKAIKTGMLAASTIIEMVNDIATKQSHIPLIIDPVMASNTGNKLSQEGYVQILSDSLLPLATIVTPNLLELYKLAPNTNSLTAACKKISSLGCPYVLITGTHDHSTEVVNRLFKNGELIDEQAWPRLPDEYHGSGCTLTASLAALLAKEIDIVQAVRDAQHYTWQCLQAGQALGCGQKHPDRLFWAKGGWSRGRSHTKGHPVD